MRKKFIILFVVTLFSCSSNTDPFSKKGQYVKFPDKLLGIDYSKLNIVELQHELKLRDKRVQCFDAFEGKNKEILSENDKNIGFVVSKNYIGDDIDIDQIIGVQYFYHPAYRYFQIVVVLKQEYFETFLGNLNCLFGAQNAYVKKESGDIIWRANPDRREMTIVEDVVISQQKQDLLIDLDSRVFYLIIRTRSQFVP